MNIEHAYPDCTGTWSLRTHEIVCSSCDQRYPATPDHRMAAVDENTLGELLQLGTREGSTLLSQEEP
jgi:hypothetical protein